MSDDKTYKIIYIWKPIPNELFREVNPDLLKIGDATLHITKPIQEYTEEELKQIANDDRIKNYTNTAGVAVDVVYAVPAINVSGRIFRDKEVHRILNNFGISRMIFDNNTSQEWFEVDLNTAKAAVQSVIDENNQLITDVVRGRGEIPVFNPRDEQKTAVKETLRKWRQAVNTKEKGQSGVHRFLWNAKPRFGKTASAYHFMKVASKTKVKKKLHPMNRVLIITHRPVVNDGWAKDAMWILGSEYAYEAKQKIENAIVQDWFETPADQKTVRFASVQDLRQLTDDGELKESVKKLLEDDYDLLIIDEAHEGIETDLAENVLEQIRRTFTLHLSGTPFKQLVNEKFKDNEIYTWDYIDEQKAKEAWSIKYPNKHNPYAALPSLSIQTIDLRQTTTDEEELGSLTEDSTFRFGKFFSTVNKVDGTVNADGSSTHEFLGADGLPYREDGLMSDLVSADNELIATAYMNPDGSHRIVKLPAPIPLPTDRMKG